MSEKRFWRRHHTNGWTGMVTQDPDGSFSVCAVPTGDWLHGVDPETGIASLHEAQARADADVQIKASHSCEQCAEWPELGAGLVSDL